MSLSKTTLMEYVRTALSMIEEILIYYEDIEIYFPEKRGKLKYLLYELKKTLKNVSNKKIGEKTIIFDTIQEKIINHA